MLTEFGNALLFIILGLVFVFMGLLVAKILRPHNPTAEKTLPYECGEDPIGPQWMRFNLRFYVVALIFILFDVELVLLFPWALVFEKLGMYAYVAGAIFIIILFLADFYLWAKGDLEWIRPQPNRPRLDDLVDRMPLRTPTGGRADGAAPAVAASPATQSE
ncbi:MAG: NADH-quinone oxidoreductase subunit A [Bacteroidota bacterium]|jgi:NADH-quinone oxidoreductase subunit A|nr:NADH-quinone oxidoreductase subunit A [Bacteroidota bacterium]